MHAGGGKQARARHLGAAEGDSDAGRPTRGRQPTALTTTPGATARARTRKTPAAAGNAPLLFFGDAERPAQRSSAASNACAPSSKQLVGGDRAREAVRSCRHRPGKCRTGPGAAPISRRSEKTPPSPLPRSQCTRSQGRKRAGKAADAEPINGSAPLKAYGPLPRSSDRARRGEAEPPPRRIRMHVHADDRRPGFGGHTVPRVLRYFPFHPYLALLG